jgi:beta-glucanase (GH16 family)
LTQVQSNYFGKGNTTTSDRGAYHPVAAPQSQFHTYTLDWTAERLTWAIDNVVVRTLKYGDANGGQNYPQTPMKVKVGSWCAGSSTAPAGTVQWAGGLTDFSKGPYSMFIKSVTVQDYTTSGSEYVYSDLTGSWQSIKVNGAAGGAAISSGSVSSSSTATKSSSAASSSGTKASTVTSASSTLATSTQTATSGAESNTKPIGNAPTATTTTSNGPTVTLATQTSSAASTSSTAKASGNAAAKRYGALDYSVIGLGLGLGYLVM